MNKKNFWLYLIIRNCFIAIVIITAFKARLSYWILSNRYEHFALIIWLVNSHLRLFNVYKNEWLKIISSFADLFLLSIASIGFIFLNNLQMLLLVPMVDSIFVLRSRWQIFFSVTIVLLYLFGAFWFRYYLNQFYYSASIFLFIALLSATARLNFDQKNKIESLYQELKTSYQELAKQASLAQELGQRLERTRIAGEIHDHIGHCLVLLIARLELFQDSIAHDQFELKNELANCTNHARQILRQSKLVVEELSQSPEIDLFYDLEKLIEKTKESSKIDISLIIPGHPLPLSPQLKGVIYRIVREGLTNAIRHGRPTEIAVTLSLKNSELAVAITDNGIGLKEPYSEGNGLRGIRDCLIPLRGRLDLQPIFPAGAILSVIFPIKEDQVVCH